MHVSCCYSKCCEEDESVEGVESVMMPEVSG